MRPRPDVVVVGTGVAGCAAALAARAEGATVLALSGGAGATSLASGAWDVAPARGARGVPPFRSTLTLADAIRAVARDIEAHPYARIPGDPVERAAAAHALVLPALGGYEPLDLEGYGVLVATELGLVRRTATVQREVLDLAKLDRRNIAVAVLRAYRACDGRLVAASLAELADAARDERRFGAVEIEFFRRRADVALHPHEVAAIADTREARDRFVNVLTRAIAGSGFGALLLPPVLGIETSAREELEAALGVPVGEVVSSLAGAQSARLVRRIAAALERAGCERRDARAVRIEPRADGTRVHLESGEELTPGAVVLATGKHVGGGIVVRGGEALEPLAGLPLFVDGEIASIPSSHAGADPAVRFGEDLADGASGWRHGVGYDETLRARGATGSIAADDLFVAGAVMDGVEPSRDGTGFGVCAATGALAGTNAAKHAGRSVRAAAEAAAPSR